MTAMSLAGMPKRLGASLVIGIAGVVTVLICVLPR